MVETAAAFKSMTPAEDLLPVGPKMKLPKKLDVKAAQRLQPRKAGCFISADKGDSVRVGYTLAGVRKEHSSSYAKWGLHEALLRCLR